MTNNFVKDNLLPNEKILATARWHWMKNTLPAVLIFILLWGITILFAAISANFLGFGIPVYFIPILCLIFAPLSYYIGKWLAKFDEFAITNLRVVAKVGVIRSIAFELHNEKVESIGVSQGILGRIFGYGTLIPGGVGASKVRIRFVKDPFELRQHFYDIKKGQQATRY